MIQLSKLRLELIKRALIQYEQHMVAEKFSRNIPQEHAAAEIQATQDLLNDINIIEKLEDIDIETPSGENIYHLINDNDIDLNDVTLDDMTIKTIPPVKEIGYQQGRDKY